jgi:rhamnosyltransferase
LNIKKKLFKLKKNDLCSIIITYQTQVNDFKKNLKSHLQNFKQVIIVNNSPQIDLSIFQSNQVMLINNSENIGLSSALNAGIREAKNLGYKIVVLFDQDTNIAPNFTQQMLQYINKYKGDKPVAVYSPVFHNHVIHETSKHINFKPFRLIRGSVDDTPYAHPHYVITSGSWIPIDVFNIVGLMREELFIDFVDIEWCLRARRKGYEIVAINKVMIDHHLGDYAVHFMGNSYPIHSPLRMYYYFRNSIYLYRLSDIDWNWRLVDSTRSLFRFFFYMLLVKNRKTYLRYIIKGYYHGFIRKMYKLEE